MADKLDWLNKHLVLVRYLTVEDAAAKEGYKLNPDVAELVEGVAGAEEAVFTFAKSGRFNCACALMAYIAHRRAAVWWGYRCVVSLAEELRTAPAEEIDLGAPPPKSELPDFAKVEIPKPDPALLASMDARRAGIAAETEKLNAAVNPSMRKYVETGVAEAFAAFERANGVHPLKLLKTLGERMRQNPYRLDPDAPLFKAVDALKTQLAAQQAQTVAQVMALHPVSIPGFIKGPPKVAEHLKKQRSAALDAVFRWIAVPNDVNSQTCLVIGNECVSTPEGLLALCAFWAFGNLMPGGEQVIPTPAGMVANGLDKVLLMCAMQKGGTRKLEERYELYFNMGVDVLNGKDNWEEWVDSGKAPHEIISPESPDAPSNQTSSSGYNRWKPKNPGNRIIL
jgi:hypothetical protein